MNPLAAYANPSIKNYAVKTGQMVTKIPLKDNTDAYLMTNDKSCEVFLLKGKEIVGGKGFRSTNSLEHAKFFKETILELQEHAKREFQYLANLLNHATWLPHKLWTISSNH